MTALFQQVKVHDQESFYIGVFQDNLEQSTWHYHNTYEICFITEGSGKRIVADSIEDFHPGDLVFIGQNLPHVWIADKEAFSPNKRSLEMVYLQFSPEVFTKVFDLPEFGNLKRALELSEHGIQIVGSTLNEVSEIMLQLPYLKGFERMLYFFRMMNLIGSSKTNLQLASNNYIKSRFKNTNTRVAAIHDYLMNHYREAIDLKRVAEVASMAEGSLCRFFKQKMGLTVFDYLNQLKVEFACKLLMDYKMSILEVCLDSGFNNLSHFNRQFRKHTGLTPTDYRKRFNIPL